MDGWCVRGGFAVVAAGRAIGSMKGFALGGAGSEKGFVLVGGFQPGFAPVVDLGSAKGSSLPPKFKPKLPS